MPHATEQRSQPDPVQPVSVADTVPVLAAPAEATGRPLHWLARERGRLRQAVAEHGALLVRGLELTGRSEAVEAGQRLIDVPCAEREGCAPRTALAPGVYSSALWPAERPEPLHHELSHALEVPSFVVLCCLRAPRSGGTTVVADSGRVLADLPSGLVTRFEQVGWQLLRHYHARLGLTWQTAFACDDPARVERYCWHHGITFHWDGQGGLRTRQHRPAVATHPATGRRSWFNQISYLSGWRLEPAVRAYLTAEFGDGGLPFTTRHGDGGAIDATTIALIDEVYDRHTRHVPWQAGDLLLLDNIRMAHGRQPYQGTREVVVALGDPLRRGGLR